MFCIAIAIDHRGDVIKILHINPQAKVRAIWQQTAQAFESAHPGVKVESYRGTRQELGARILAETQAKRYILDTIVFASAFNCSIETTGFPDAPTFEMRPKAESPLRTYKACCTLLSGLSNASSPRPGTVAL